MDYVAEFERWLASDALNTEERAELEAIRGDDEAIKDRFFAPLSFGTAGLRGILGTGLYRMNRFTVGAATQGLANLILQYGEDAMKRGVSIAYDSRHMSPEFAQLAASILAANGIDAALINHHSLKPFDEALTREYAAKFGKVFTLEEHSVIGGLGDAVASALCGMGLEKFQKIGINDEFGQSGKPAHLLEEYGLTGKQIAEKIMNA